MKIRDIIQNNGLIRGPFGSDMKKDRFCAESPDSIKVLTQENIFNKNQISGTYFITPAYFKKMRRFEVSDNDILITCDGTLGEIFYIGKLLRKSVINSSLLIVRLNPNNIDYLYFCYYWETILKKRIVYRNANSCLKHLPSIPVIEDENIDVPDLDVQKNTVALILPIDKKISLNLNIINVLINKIKECTYAEA